MDIEIQQGAIVEESQPGTLRRRFRFRIALPVLLASCFAGSGCTTLRDVTVPSAVSIDTLPDVRRGDRATMVLKSGEAGNSGSRQLPRKPSKASRTAWHGTTCSSCRCAGSVAAGLEASWPALRW
jgi:hypothetical protein